MIYTLTDYVFSQSERGQLLVYITMPELAKHIINQYFTYVNSQSLKFSQFVR